MQLLWSTLLLVFLTNEAQSYDIVKVEVQSGTLIGRNSSKGFLSFLGVRYAQAPVGPLRFKPPRPLANFTGVDSALHVGYQCVQSLNPSLKESEDCLFLNIWTPSNKGSLPVMVWIHGGFFNGGSGNEFSGEAYMKKGVVFVSINYRLGPFGYLSTETSDIPGNYGSLDQIEALKWVQRNIAAFGGDPKQVTIFGESAGSVSVSLLTLSPLAKGLFKRAIMESGSALSVFSVTRPQSTNPPRKVVENFFKYMNCTASFQICVEYLRHVKATDLMKLDFATRRDFGNVMLDVPRVETDYGFMPDYPSVLLKNGQFNKVDTIHGYNSGEYSVLVKDPDNNGVTVTEFAKYFSSARMFYSFNTIQNATQRVVEMYYNHTGNPLWARSQLVYALNDASFAMPDVLEIQSRMKQDGGNYSHYFYRFGYVSGVQKYLRKDWEGVRHAGELDSVFGRKVTLKTDALVSDQVITMWTNFARTGNPTPNGITSKGSTVTWDKVSKTKFNLLDIKDPLRMTEFPRMDKLSMYRDLLSDLLQK